MPAFSPTSAQPGLELFPGCMESCSCPSDDFNPVCDSSSRVEYITPCHAGCRSRVVQEVPDTSQVGQASGCPLPLTGSALPVSVRLSHPPHLNILILWLFFLFISCLLLLLADTEYYSFNKPSLPVLCQGPECRGESDLVPAVQAEGSNSGIPGVVKDRSGPHKDNQ